MRHFIAYHNPEKMGYQYTVPQNSREHVLTNKPVQHIIGNMVWVVTFKERHNYALASVFQVADSSDTNEGGFKHRVSGKGHPFRPWREIKDFEWFPTLLKVTGNFGLGLQEVTERSVIEGLIGVADQGGYTVEIS